MSRVFFCSLNPPAPATPPVQSADAMLDSWALLGIQGRPRGMSLSMESHSKRLRWYSTTTCLGVCRSRPLHRRTAIRYFGQIQSRASVGGWLHREIQRFRSSTRGSRREKNERPMPKKFDRRAKDELRAKYDFRSLPVIAGPREKTPARANCSTGGRCRGDLSRMPLR